MKTTICVTQRCTLTCSYCTAQRGDATMSPRAARSVVDSIFENAPAGQKIEIDFAGGEPLLEVPTLMALTDLVERHSAFDPLRVKLAVVSNGTIFSDEIAVFLREHDIRYVLSCDGPPAVQDRFRRFADGRGSSEVVERTVRSVLGALGSVPVRAVYRPETLRSLPDAVEYLAAIGLRQIHLDADFSGRWSKADADALPAVYEAVAYQYVKSHLGDAPLFVSLLDAKIALLLRGGYQPTEPCPVGEAGLAFAPDGRVHECAQHVGCAGSPAHRAEDATCVLALDRGGKGRRRDPPAACRDCELLHYCKSRCGSPSGDEVGPFLCASERASIETAGRAFQTLQTRLGPAFTSHVA